MDKSITQICKTRYSESHALVDRETLEIKPLRCKSWNCPICSKQKAGVHKKRIIIGSPERFFTLTNVGRSRKEIAGNWKNFVRDLRRRGYQIQFARVIELEPSGIFNIHAVQRGDFMPQRQLSKLARANNMGYIVDVRKVKKGRKASSNVASYITKYLVKRSKETTESLPGVRLVTYSRKWLSEVLTKTLEAWREKGRFIVLTFDWITEIREGGASYVQTAEARGP